MDPDREGQAAPRPTERSVSPLVFLTAFMRRRRLMAGIALVGIVGITSYTLIRGLSYSATLTFMPQVSGGALSGLAGVAAQFGIAVPTGSPDQTPQFYSELIGTDPFQDDLVATEYSAVVGRTADGKRDSVVTQSLVDWLSVDPDRPPAQRRGLANNLLPGIMSVIPDVQSSMVTVTVTTAYPDLSKEVADRVLALVNRFNTVRRGADAGTERRFVEGRLAVARDSLAADEDRVLAFLQRNRTYLNSPTLVLEHDRLQREVDFEQQVVATLMQAVEQARITEVRNTPVVTVIEAPKLADLHDRRRFLLKWTLAIMLALLIGVAVSLVSVGLQVEEVHEPDASSALRSAWDGTLSDIRRLTIPFRWAWQKIRRRRE